MARAEEATDRVVSGLEAVAAMALVREVVVVAVRGEAARAVASAVVATAAAVMAVVLVAARAEAARAVAREEVEKVAV